MKKLYLVHCGFYDPDCFDGIFESHADFMVVAESVEDAKKTAKSNPSYKNKRMHIDGLQEVAAVNGHRVFLEADASLNGASQIISHTYRQLAKTPDPV